MSLSYLESIDFLYALQKHGIKLGLETIQALLRRLGQPPQRYPSFHIAGTTGKGSTAAMIAAMLQAAGHRVGLYTSPHLVDFRERIRVNGEPIPEAVVATLTQSVSKIVGGEVQPTFFEFTTALALLYFADSDVEVAVVEVGMGGRLDATNVLTPLVSAITNISLDHQLYLGNTIGSIATEKAGIIKPQVPVVVGPLSSEAAEVIEHIAEERGAPLYHANRDFRTLGESPQEFNYRGLERSYSALSCSLDGAHQLDNAACALAMLELACSRGIALSEDAIRSGLKAVCWEGRLELVERHPDLVLDGAHNPAAAAAVAAYLAVYRDTHPKSRVVMVIGMMRDKDHRRFLQTILPYADDVVLTQTDIPRAATCEELRSAMGERAATAQAAPIPADALTLARRLAGREDLLLVTGSLILVGEFKALLRGCSLSPLRD